MSVLLELAEIDKSFGAHRVLDRVSLTVQPGEVLVLLGASGSGKTTLLRLIAGFEQPDAGELVVDGELIGAQPPARRRFGMVFQHYALFPHLTVGQNVGFGLEMRGVPGVERAERVRRALALVDLAGFEDRQVHQISGGQQQRVAVARALAPEPRILLLDEPLSNLDPELRERTRRQLRRAIDQVGITAVWVTHEQQEAFDVGDRVAILNQGRLEQVGPPERLYLEPATRYVAGFVGQASFLPATVSGPAEVTLGDERFVGTSARWAAAGDEQLEPGVEVDLMVRPEGLALAPEGAAGAMTGQVLSRRYAGETTFYRVRIDDVGEAVVAGAVGAARPGDRVAVALEPSSPPPRWFRRRDEADS